MQNYNLKTTVYRIEDSEQSTIEEAIQGICSPTDDTYLVENGWARLGTQADLSYNSATQKIVNQNLAYDSDKKLFFDIQVVNLSATELLTNAVIAKITALGAKYVGLVNAGFNYSGHVYQIDTDSAVAMSIVKQQINTGIAGLGYWVDAVNVPRVMNDTQVVTFINAAYGYGAGLKNTLFTKRAAMMVVTSQTQLDAIDVNSGWPANNE